MNNRYLVVGLLLALPCCVRRKMDGPVKPVAPVVIEEPMEQTFMDESVEMYDAQNDQNVELTEEFTAYDDQLNTPTEENVALLDSELDVQAAEENVNEVNYAYAESQEIVFSNDDVEKSEVLAMKEDVTLDDEAQLLAMDEDPTLDDEAQDQNSNMFNFEDDTNRNDSTEASSHEEMKKYETNVPSEELEISDTEVLAYNANDLKPMYYDFNSEQIRYDQKDTLDKNIEVAKALNKQGYSITVKGHSCNSAGTEEYNKTLSRLRAESIANQLKEQNVDCAVEACGCANLLKRGNKEEQAPNRRVEILAYKE